MREQPPLRAAACPLIALLLLGCDDAKMCQPCNKPAEPAQTVIAHNTFNFRFAPPWLNTDQLSLFTSHVVFSKEAKFEEWNDGLYESCNGDDAPAAVCPERGFYKQAMAPLLARLAQYATKDKKVELHTVGFASSSGIEYPKKDENEVWSLEDRHAQHIDQVSGLCQGKLMDSERQDPSAMFNLLIANKRAANVRDMLRELASAEKEKFNIADKPWCSHASMAKERKLDDGGQNYDPSRGLMNRRVEVRPVAFPDA